MKKQLLSLTALVLSLVFNAAAQVHTSYLWHMDQPIYWGEKSKANPNRMQLVKESQDLKTSGDAWNKYSDGLSHPLNDLMEIFSKDDRVQAYQWRPKTSIETILSKPDAGAQVSISGCLMENINSLAQAGQWGYASNWYDSYKTARSWTTSGGFPRLDVVSFSNDHAFSPLISERTLRKQIQVHKNIYAKYYGSSPVYSKGYWPAECAFSERIIKALVLEGIEWSVIANSHLSRTLNDYPLAYGTSGCNIDPPNKADKVTTNGNNWWNGQTDGRGGTFAAPYCYQAHKAKYVDPATGTEYKITVVPMCDLLSYKDGYSPMSTADIDSKIAPFNNPAQNSLVLLAHDGDNAFGGGYTYYQESVPNFVNAAAAKGYKPTTVQQFLASNPVPANDVVKVEDGAWVNADSDWGHPQFINWLWPLYSKPDYRFNPDGWTEDARNWAVITATENYVTMAEDLSGGVNVADIASPSATSTNAEKAWHFYFGQLNSGYMYYGKSLDMEVKQTVAGNNAITFAQNVINANPTVDNTAPSVFIPQRFPYNPGEKGFGPLYGYKEFVNSTNFHVWTYAFDVNGLQSVVLKYRTDLDDVNPLSDNINDTYAGGAGVTAWQSITMTRKATPKTNVANDPEINFFMLPTAIADLCYAEITGLKDTLVDYYVEATDTKGNVFKTPIQHVWIGKGGTNPNPNPKVTISPANPTANDIVTITVTDAAASTLFHWGVNPVGTTWTTPHASYQPSGTTLFGTGPAVQTPFSDPDADGVFTIKVGPFNNAAQAVTKVSFVLHYGNGTWDNNGGLDYGFNVTAVTNNNPTGANATVSMNKNSTFTFGTSNFSFTSPVAATFAGVRVTALPTLGSLKYNGVAAAINTDYANPALLTYTPTTNGVGSPYTTFSFKVKDNAARYSDATYSMTINVINQYPTSNNQTVVTPQNTVYTFKSADFDFVSPVGATFTAVRLASLPALGTVKYNGAAAAINTDYVNPALLTYTPVTGGLGSPYTFFKFNVKDNAGRVSEISDTMTVAVIDPNPVSGNKTVDAALNTTYNFANADIAFSSPVGATFESIRIVTLPSVGSLKHNGVAAVVNTDYEPSLLTYTPATGGWGSPYASFTFKVKDNGARISTNSYTMTINVANSVPTGANGDVLMAMNGTYTFSNANFTYSNTSGAAFGGVVVSTLPALGTLKYNGTNVTVNQVCTNPALLTYTPVTSGAGYPYTTFNFFVRDVNGVNSASAYTMTVGVAGTGVKWYPVNPTVNDVITVTINSSTVGGKLHWGVNGVGTTWTTPNTVYRPAGTVLFNGTGPAVQSAFTARGNNLYSIKIGPFNNAAQAVSKVDFVIAYDNGTWDNNASADYHITVGNTTPTGGNTTVNGLPNTAYTFATGNFPFTGVNGSTFAGVRIVTLPAVGTLTYNGTAVTANADYANVTLLKYKGANGGIGNGYASFTFKVKDSNGQYSSPTYTATVNIQPEAGVKWYPANPTINDVITITINTATQGGKLHWGVNGVGSAWVTPNTVYRPAGSTLWNGTGPAIESAFTGPTNNILSINIGPFNNVAQAVSKVDFVLHYNDNTWNNNGTADFHITIAAAKDVTTSVDMVDVEVNMSIYPQPMSHTAILSLPNVPNDSYMMRVYDVAGKCVRETSFSGSDAYIERGNLQQGVYVVKVDGQSNKQSFVSKLVVE